MYKWLTVTTEPGLIVSSWLTPYIGQSSPERFESITGYVRTYACLPQPQSHQYVWDAAPNRAKRVRWLEPVINLEYLHQRLRT